MVKNYDFSGWATRNDIKCSDGRTIRRDAFKDNDGKTVPLVWNHDHKDAFNVLGHATLENRADGVYAYCTLNDTEQGQNAKKLIEHGDVSALSIYANKLKQRGGDVLHGAIREVSLVLAGANPGAFIDTVMQHGEDSEEEAIMYIGGQDGISIEHADSKGDNVNKDNTNNDQNASNDDEKTIQDVIDSMTEEQQNVLYALVGMAANGELGGDEESEDSGSESDSNKVKHSEEDETYEGENILKHNVFDDNSEMKHAEDYLSHAEMMSIIDDAPRYGSLKESVLQHGITNIDYLFPDAQTVDKQPSFIKRNTEWVDSVINGAHHVPFSRVKSIHANLTEDDARAVGYIKGKQKKEEVFPLLKRATTPTTVTKLQKMDRDDIIDITDFDVVAWVKSEMRGMLNEEIARAILVGDGRPASSDDHINDQCIRPIWTDEDLYTIKCTIPVVSTMTSGDFVDVANYARINYKGSGNPVLYTTEDVLTACLLTRDSLGRLVYENVNQLANALRVSNIVTVPIMNQLTRTLTSDEIKRYGVDASKEPTVVRPLGIIVNMDDYTIGADKGGEVNLFDDFDINYNKYEYLIETRCSGAMTTPYGAIAIEGLGVQSDAKTTPAVDSIIDEIFPELENKLVKER